MKDMAKISKRNYFSKIVLSPVRLGNPHMIVVSLHKNPYIEIILRLNFNSKESYQK